MRCPSCHADIPDTSRFCMACGAPLLLRCPACATANPAGARSCLGCDRPLDLLWEAARGESLATGPSRLGGAVAAERRQLTVLFCDLVGSTALSARLDPEDLREVIRAFHSCCRAVIDAAGGFVAQYMGDGVLSYFGYPQAHEDDAERAVRCGLSLVDAVTKLYPGHGVFVLQVRIGIATGVVVVGDRIGIDNAQQPSVIGETPNLAARLQALAEPNQVIIASSTRRLTGGLFEYRDLGRRSLKGWAAPVQAWQVIGTSSVQSRFEASHETGPAPLVGREEELDLLFHAWRRAVGGEGSGVLIMGEPGIGKSRLIAALQECLAVEPYTAIRCFCSPQHTDSALYPVIAEFRRAATLTPDDPPEQRLAKFLALLARTAVEAAGTPVAHTEQSIALLADLLSVPTGGRYRSPELSPQGRKEKTLEALVTHLGAVAAWNPVLLVFEDIHWIDPTSLELLTSMLERIPRWRVLAIMTARPEFTTSWPVGAAATVVPLKRLNQQDAKQLVTRTAGGKALPGEVLEQILSRTDGVPLFVEELTKSVLESGVLREENGHYRLAGPLPPHAVPSTLHSSLSARLDRIGCDPQIAQIGAAIGREFSYELLRAVARSLPEERVRAALDQLVASGLVLLGGRAPRLVYAFKHALVQDAAYDTLLRDQRRQLHTDIAAALEEGFPQIAEQQPALLAHHCTQAGRIDKAISYWVKAGQQSFARSSATEAIAQLGKGFELVETLPESPARWRQELALQWPLCAALMVAKGQAAAETGQAFSRSRELCEKLGDTTSLLQVLSGQCAYHIGRGELAAGRRIAEQLVDLGRQHDDPTALRVGSMHMGTCLYSLGEFVAAREHLERVLALSLPDARLDARGTPPDRPSFGGAWDSQVASLSCLSLLLFALGYPQQARARRNEALARSRKLGHPHILAYGLLMAASFDWLSREPDADSALEPLISVCAEQRFPHWLAVGTMLRAHTLAARGDTAEGLALARRALGEYAAMGFAWGQTTLLVVLAHCCEKARQSEEAFDALTTGLAVAGRTGERYFEAELHRLRGEWLAAHRQEGPEEAEAELRRGLAAARRQSARMWELRAATSLGRLWRDQARFEEARALVAPVYASFTEGLSIPDLADARALLDSLP